MKKEFRLSTFRREFFLASWACRQHSGTVIVTFAIEGVWKFLRYCKHRYTRYWCFGLMYNAYGFYLSWACRQHTGAVIVTFAIEGVWKFLRYCKYRYTRYWCFWLTYNAYGFLFKLSLQATHWNCYRTNPYRLIPIPTFPNEGRRKLIYFSIIAKTSASLPVLWFLNLISFCVSSGVNSDFW